MVLWKIKYSKVCFITENQQNEPPQNLGGGWHFIHWTSVKTFYFSKFWVEPQMNSPKIKLNKYAFCLFHRRRRRSKLCSCSLCDWLCEILTSRKYDFARARVCMTCWIERIIIIFTSVMWWNTQNQDALSLPLKSKPYYRSPVNEVPPPKIMGGSLLLIFSYETNLRIF